MMGGLEKAKVGEEITEEEAEEKELEKAEIKEAEPVVQIVL